MYNIKKHLWQLTYVFEDHIQNFWLVAEEDKVKSLKCRLASLGSVTLVSHAEVDPFDVHGYMTYEQVLDALDMEP